MLAVLAWRQAVIARGANYRFFEHVRTITAYVVFQDWDHLLRSITAAAIRPPWRAGPTNHALTPTRTRRSPEKTSIHNQFRIADRRHGALTPWGSPRPGTAGPRARRGAHATASPGPRTR